MKKVQGSITVFLSMILMLLLSVVLILLESARISSASARAEGISYTGMDSCFGKYGKELFEEYEVFALWNSKEQFLNNFKRVTISNCNSLGNTANKYPNWYGLELEEADLTSLEYLTERDGEVFEKQVVEAVLYHLGEEAVKALWKKTEKLSQGEAVKEFYEKMQDCNEQFSKAENAVRDVQSEIGELHKAGGVPMGELEFMKERASEISDENSKTEDKRQILSAYQSYQQWEKVVEKIIGDLEKSIGNFQKYSAQARINVEELHQKTGEMKEKLDAEVYDVIEQEVRDIKNKFQVQDGYNISECEKAVGELKTSLEKINTLLEGYMSDKMTQPQQIQDAIAEASQWDMSKVVITTGEVVTEHAENTIEEGVKSVLAQGILKLVTDNSKELSDKKAELDEVPSLHNANKGDEWKRYDETEALMRKAAFGEYVLTHFGHYVKTQSDTTFDYEIEYLLSGKENDTENLANVVGELLAIRGGFNMISIFRDAQKSEDTYLLASSIAGAAGMPVMIKMIQVGIVALWAEAEAVIDIRNLLAGRKIALIKNATQWNLSIENLPKLKADKKTEDDIGGLNYEDYLRYLLGMENKALLANRAMDLLQLNVQKRYQKEFRMSECFSAAKLSAVYRISPLFSGIFEETNLSQGFHIRISQKYAY